MEKHIVILNGNGGCGKDTFANLCAKYAKVKKCSTVDKIKEAASLIGWSPSLKDDEDSRKFLADFKTLLTNYNDFPFKEILKSIDEFKNDDNEILFLFIREIPEIKRLLSINSNVKTLLLTNKNTKFIVSNEADKNVLNFDYDYIINNDDNKVQLDKKAENFVNMLRETK